MATSISSNTCNYITERELGHGGFGCALLVRRQSDGARFVMKEINLNRLAHMALNDTIDRSKVVKFARKEAEVLAQVAHPNIVRVFEAFADGNNFYIIMEFCDSGTLKDVIKARKGEHFPEAQIRNWTAQLALTLKYLHDRKILHRDVKTENVFLTGGGRIIKLGDFGIAKTLERPEQSAYTGVGTVANTAPEHCQGRGYSHKSEVWSFGVVIYELAALHLPFRTTEQSANYMALFVKICTMDPEPFPGEYSPELRDLVCGKLLTKNPDERPSMADVVLHPSITGPLAELSGLGATLNPASHAPGVALEEERELVDNTSEIGISSHITSGIQVVMQSNLIDDLYKHDICSAMKEHKLTLDLLKELSDEELAEMFPQIGPRKAVKKFAHSIAATSAFFPALDESSNASGSEDPKSETSSIDEGHSDPPAPQVIKGRKKFWPNSKHLMSKAKEVASLFTVMRKSMSMEFVGHSVYSAWSKNKPKEPFTTSSPVVAILISHTSKQSNALLVVTLMCLKGEILSCKLSNDERQKVEWQGRLRLETGQTINHAVIDAKNDDIYITMCEEEHNRKIYGVNRIEIMAAATRLFPSTNGKDVALKSFISTTNCHFFDLAVDNRRHLLLACCPAQGDVTLWSLEKGQLVGAINCQTLQYGVHPFCCAVYSSKQRTFVAVCDRTENCINLFVRDDETGNKESDSFSFTILVACANQSNPAAAGSVFEPNDVTFDSDGNLIVSESENRRFQVFSLVNNTAPAGSGGQEAISSNVLWTSCKQKTNPYRIAVTSNHASNKPLAILSLKSAAEWHLLWFQ